MHTNDVRPTSADSRYSGVVFSGPMKQAIAQAKAAPDHALPHQTLKFCPGYPRTTFSMGRDRYNLLNFLGLLS